jgi:hypothetical protein
MSIIVPDVGLTPLLEQLLQLASIASYTYHLYTNNYTPIHGSVIGDFTEATSGAFPGYAAQAATPWGTPTVASSVATSTAPMLTWTASSMPGSPVTIYGYYVDDGAGNLLWAELFQSPVVVTNSGDSVNLIPLLTMISQF